LLVIIALTFLDVAADAGGGSDIEAKSSPSQPCSRNLKCGRPQGRSPLLNYENPPDFL
jgi:hypothetical protein